MKGIEMIKKPNGAWIVKHSKSGVQVEVSAKEIADIEEKVAENEVTAADLVKYKSLEELNKMPIEELKKLGEKSIKDNYMVAIRDYCLQKLLEQMRQENILLESDTAKLNEEIVSVKQRLDTYKSKESKESNDAKEARQQNFKAEGHSPTHFANANKGASSSNEQNEAPAPSGSGCCVIA